MNEVEKYLCEIPWASARQMTLEADALAQQHIALMRNVLEYRSRMSGCSLLEAYSDAQSAGNEAKGHLNFLRMLFKRINFRGVPAKEPLILTISSYYFWERDPEMGHLKNPWAPLMRLYELGYTSTFDEDEETSRLDVIIEYEEGSKVYPLVINQDEEQDLDL
ncbi:hypothetical protein [Mastigocoleus sp. MO_188.B34]|uniref:hypothetical protein n=1 Tax=Mastigocoleus sp. MO_188.B34 TaxID=3036635 RepID=UPI00262B6193|nr:hypothetical protein [Mastigocoleus sp. MO_188.B34]MDJ0694548.1 hypothetical protein [Mastigocoleus sp. MO_188.B34]